MEGKNIREEPKGIVVLSKLLLLFQFCHLCFFPKPKVAVTQTGTMLTIESACSNCGDTPGKPTRSSGPVPCWELVVELCGALCWCFNKEGAFGVSTDGYVGLS